MEYPMFPNLNATAMPVASGAGNPGPGLLDGIDNSVNVPPSWRTGPSGSISTGTQSVELAGEHVFAEPSIISSHWHASGPGGMPVIAIPPAPLHGPLHQLELEQLRLHASMHAPGAMPLYASGPMPMHASGAMPMPMHASSGPMPMPMHASVHASGPMPHAFPSQDQVIMGLRNEIAELKNNNMIIYASYSTLFSAFNSLVRLFPIAVGFNAAPLEQVDYPDVKFWNLADWTKFSKENQTVGPTGAMQYVEDQHGHAVSEESVHLMRSLAQNLWLELGITGAAPTSWRKVDVQSKKFYYHAMAASFFNLRLCASDWKAEKIAEDNYALWYLRWRVQTQTPEAILQSKRVRNTSTVAQGQSKKSKVKNKESSGNLVDQDCDNIPEKNKPQMG